MTKKQIMLKLVKHYHAGQTREGGTVLYWKHCVRVSNSLASALRKTREGTRAQKTIIALTGLGHDLYEDTKIERTTIIQEFGREVDELIESVSNRGGDGLASVKKYAKRMAKSSEKARLVKLADLEDNFASGAKALKDNGEQWTRQFLWPILETQWQILRASKYQDFPKTAKLLTVAVTGARNQLVLALGK